MQITSESNGDAIELCMTGRLDNESSDQLTVSIQDAMRQGSHSILLDLSGVDYISSAGVGALVKAHKQLQQLHGTFRIVAISPEAAEVIQLTGLAKILLADVGHRSVSRSGPVDTQQSSLLVSEKGDMTYEIYELHPNATLRCEVIGSPEPFGKGVFQSEQCHSVPFPTSTIGLGLGAFGRDFADCSQRFGEFLSVNGHVAQQPTNLTSKPDFQRVIGGFVPSMQTLYGITCQGEFSRLVRFERSSPDDPLKLSAMADQFLKVADTDLSAMVLLAESAGLIGAAVRRSPTETTEGQSSRMTHPEIRRWLSFTPNHSYSHTLVLAVGIVARGNAAERVPALAPLLRPLAQGGSLQGHFHAAVFSYRPFKKRKLDLNESVGALFETEDLRAVLHLLHDDRKISGSGESEFVSGACWLGPIAPASAARAN